MMVRKPLKFFLYVCPYIRPSILIPTLFDNEFVKSTFPTIFNEVFTDLLVCGGHNEDMPMDFVFERETYGYLNLVILGYFLYFWEWN